jgi:radical SAM protein with 4Fe4S-binding SPASM domain
MKKIQTVPRKRIHHEKNGVHIFVNPYVGGKFVTDDAGARVIELMDDARDEEVLADRIAGELGINAYEAAARFITFFNHLESHRMFGEGAEEITSIPKPNVGFLEITRTCDTRCRLCYVDSGEAREDTLDTEQLFDVIDQMVDMGVRFIALSGGDPLTRPDMIEVVEHIHDTRGITAGLSTSLLSLTEVTARRMKELEVLIQVSLDGSAAEINDWNRGQGSYEKAMHGLELLRRYDIPFRFAYLINKHNIDDVDRMVELAERLGAKEVAFGKVKIAGRAKAHEREAYPGPEEMVGAYHKLYRKEIQMREADLVIRCKHNQGLITGLGVRVGCLPCGAGRTFVQVSHNGDIVPCSLLANEKDFYLGNVRTDRLRDVWENAPVFNFFRNTTADDIDICRNCPAKYLCGGGCRADAYLKHGDLYGTCGDCEDLLYYYDWILDRGCKPEFVTAF